MYSEKFDSPVVCPPGKWTPVFYGDAVSMTWLGKLLLGVFPFLSVHKNVVGAIYLNVSGGLVAGRYVGAYDVRAVRVGTTDDTSVLDHTVCSTRDGGFFQSFHSHPPWIGKNPKGFRWEVRPRVNIAQLVVSTRYIKHYGIAVT